MDNLLSNFATTGDTGLLNFETFVRGVELLTGGGGHREEEEATEGRPVELFLLLPYCPARWRAVRGGSDDQCYLARMTRIILLIMLIGMLYCGMTLSP